MKAESADEFFRAWNEMNKTLEMLKKLTLAPTAQSAKTMTEGSSGIHGGMQ